jgi:outer membrane protein with beta-barrel domain
MKHAIALAFGLALFANQARAEDDESLPMFQAALYGGYRMGGSLEDAETGDSRDLDESSSFAVSFELRYGRGDDRFYQLWYSRQSTNVSDGVNTFDTDVEYLHIGGTLPFGGWEHAQPYFAAGLGITRFSASDPAADDRTKFSGSAAFGLEVPLGKRAALRFEGRGYLTFTDTDTAFFCSSNNGEGVCRIVATGSSIFQGEAVAGILVRF